MKWQSVLVDVGAYVHELGLHKLSLFPSTKSTEAVLFLKAEENCQLHIRLPEVPRSLQNSLVYLTLRVHGCLTVCFCQGYFSKWQPSLKRKNESIIINQVHSCTCDKQSFGDNPFFCSIGAPPVESTKVRMYHEVN